MGTSPFENNVMEAGMETEKFSRFSISDMTDAITFYVTASHDYVLKMYEPILTTNLKYLRPLLIG